MEMGRDKRIIDITCGELEAIVESVVRRLLDERLKDEAPASVRGLQGIADLYGCSRRTAARIKASGVLDDAIFQVGRTIVTDTRKALELKPLHN